jgi:hypothetical protein
MSAFTSDNVKVFGPHAMSELSPQCAPKRTSAIYGFTPWLRDEDTSGATTCRVAPVAVRHVHAAPSGHRSWLRTVASSRCALAVPARCCPLGSRHPHRCVDKRGSQRVLDNRYEGLTSTVGWDSVRSDKLRKLRRHQHRLQQLRRLPPLHGLWEHHGNQHDRHHHDKRPRDESRRDKRQFDQHERLLDMRRRQ